MEHRPPASPSADAAAWADGLHSPAPGTGKLATQLARRIEEEILRRGWPVGERLGREEELSLRFGVSRAVLREALAITEQDGLTRRERGRHGGLAIAAPAESAVITSLGNYLHLAGVRAADVAPVWQMLERAVVRWAAERCTAADTEALRRCAGLSAAPGAQAAWAHAARLRAALLDMTHNRVARVFGQTLSHLALARLHVGPSGDDEAALVAQAHAVAAGCAEQADAVIADRLDVALAVQAQLTPRWLQCFDAGPPDGAALDAAQADRAVQAMAALQSPRRPVKRAEVLAWQLSSWLAGQGQGGGKDAARLDTEPALMARYGVGRGVLREAIRYLERYSVVRMDKGRGGGLRLAQADPENAVRSAVLLFRSLGVEAWEIDELSREIETTAAAETAARIARGDATAVAPLSAALDAWPLAVADPVQHLERVYGALTAMAGNPILVLLMRIFDAYLQAEQRAAAPAAASAQAQHAVYVQRMRTVEAALLQGDVTLARRAMLWARDAAMFMRPRVRDLPGLLDRVY